MHHKGQRRSHPTGVQNPCYTLSTVHWVWTCKANISTSPPPIHEQSMSLMALRNRRSVNGHLVLVIKLFNIQKSYLKYLNKTNLDVRMCSQNLKGKEKICDRLSNQLWLVLRKVYRSPREHWPRESAASQWKLVTSWLIISFSSHVILFAWELYL